MRLSTKANTTWFRSSSIVALLCLGSAVDTRAQGEFLCVWRNPERTMTRLFPSAVDYRTVTKRIAVEQRAAIERETGSELLPGQRDQFSYFELLGAGGRKLGHVIAASQKGEFGAIEFVMGLDSAGTVNGMYIQRSRERDVAFKEPAFVDGFKGVGIRSRSDLAKRTRAEENRGKKAVLQGVLKELVAFETLATK